MQNYSLKKILFVVIGTISLALGAIGTAVPFLPSFPFLMVAGICYAKSSERLNNWFIGTKLYKNNLESFVQGKGMTKKAKFRIMGVVTLTMAFGFAMMGKVPVARIVLAIVWIIHILYFVYGIKTISEQTNTLPSQKE